MWTKFWDMHSGGSQKLKWDRIYIEAPEAEAKSVFYAKFNRNADRVTCSCCGPDYTVDEGPDLCQLTAYDRGCRYDDTLKKYVEEQRDQCASYVSLAAFFGDKAVRFVYHDEIKDEERHVAVPESGYVWKE